MSRPAIKIQARQWLFPLASVYAMLILPLSVLSILGKISWLPAMASPYAHAHELVFAVALLVICGYLLGNRTRQQLLYLVGLWLAGRLSFLWLGFHPLAAIFTAAIAVILIWQVVPAFWRAKKWQNRSVAPIVALIGLFAAIAGSDAWLFVQLLPKVFLLLAALMFFMGGRIIAPLLASFWLQRGERMSNRVQPGMEGGGLLALGLALLLELSGLLLPLKGLLLLAAGLVIALRILRWRPWLYAGRADIVFMFIGYAGLALAVLLLGAAEFSHLAAQLASHALMVAALGALMVTIMARVTQIRKFKDANHLRAAHVASALLVAAAAARLSAPLLPGSYMLLLSLASLCWSLGFASLLWLFWRCR